MKKIKILISIILLMFLLFTSSCSNKENNTIPTSKQYINAKSYIVLDQISGRILEGQNTELRVLPASTTKILTCLTVINYFDINNYIVITKDMINTVGSRIYLEEGDIIKIKDLLYGLMLNSGNDASISLAIGLTGNTKNFVYLMNEECKRIGMYNSTFENPSGLDETSKNITTAYDMALLMRSAMNNKVFREITNTKEYQAVLLNGRKLYFNNKHKLVLINDLVIGGKTGYTKKAGRTLITSYKKDKFEIVVATFDCANDWEVHNNLANEAFNNYKQIKLTNSFKIFQVTNIKNISEKLLFPISENENKNDFNITVNEVNNEYYLSYYKNNLFVAKVKLKENE